MKKFVWALSALSLAYSALAVNVVGKYNGKHTIDFSPTKDSIRKNAGGKKMTPDQIKMATNGIDAQAKMIDAISIKLELKKDGTLTIEQTNGAKGKPQTDNGKWTLKGNKITLSGLSKNDKGPKELMGTVSKDGKSLFFDLSDEMKKQPTGGFAAPKGSMTFKRA